jgi:hypothetical protein
MKVSVTGGDMVTSAIRRLALYSGVVVLLIASSIHLTTAQQGGSGLIISPTRTELEVAAGASDKISIRLQNVSGVDVTAKAEVNDFESDGVTGEPKIITDPDNTSPYSIRKFLSNVGDVQMSKDERKDFDIIVDVPADTVAGAYYGVIRYTAAPGGEQQPGEGTIALNASVGTLVMITVPGNITEQIQVRSVKVSQNKKAGNFFFKTPDKVDVEIKNNGNGFAKPFGRVQINRGKSEVYSYELNNTEPKANILPQSVRLFSNGLENIKTPGRYSVVANLSHGAGGDVITYSTSFWYIPLWIIITIGVILLVIILGGYLLYRRKFRKQQRPGRR